MAYSMIIVDDEKIIREGLKKYISDNDFGFDVCGVFEDGKDAIRYLDENRADLVFTDIRMFEISGVELAEYICRTSPDTAIVFLSGYKDFEYARQAIKNNVSHYLLKPVKNEEIRNVLGEIKKKLDAERLNKTKIERFDEIVRLRREQFFSDFLFCGFENTDECRKKFEGLEFPFSSDSVCCTILKIMTENGMGDKWLYGKDGLHTAINNYFLVYDELAYYSLFLDGEMCLVLSENKGICLDGYAERLKEWLDSFCRVKAEVKVEYACTGIYDLCDHFTAKSEEDNSEDKEWILDSKYKLLNTYIALNMPEDAKKLFGSLLYEYNVESYSSAVKVIKEMCEKLTGGGGKIDDGQYIEMLKETIENNDYSGAVRNIFDRIAESMRNVNGNDNALIVKIKEYVKQNYASDITLDEVAGQVFLNSVYMSRYFKQHTGESFTDYLLSVRIVNSIRLLRSGKYKVYEIAEMVGYGSSRYFSKQFKNYTGYTPKAYLKSIWNKDICE